MTRHPPLIYSAHLRRLKWSTDPKTGAPLPLQLTLEIQSLASCYSLLRDVSNCRIPITISIDSAQPPLPNPRAGTK